MKQFYYKTLFTFLLLFGSFFSFSQTLTDLGPTQGLASNSTTSGFNTYKYATSEFGIDVHPVSGVPYVAYISSGGSPVIQKYVNGAWALEILFSAITNADYVSIKFQQSGTLIMAIVDTNNKTYFKKWENGVWSDLGSTIQSELTSFSITSGGDIYASFYGNTFKRFVNSDWVNYTYTGTEIPASSLHSDGTNLYGFVFVAGTYITYLKNYTTGTKQVVIDNGSSLLTSDEAGNVYVLYGKNGNLSVAKVVNGSLQVMGTRTFAASSIPTATMLLGKNNSLYLQLMLSSSSGLNIDISKLENSTFSTLANYEINKYNSYIYSYSSINKNNDDIYVINPSSVGAFAKKYSQPVVLPVSLINFKATKSGTHAVLNWSTSSEVNNNYFIVERSVDNQNFKELAKVSSKDNNAAGANYTFIDDFPENGVNYYHLNLVDKDGANSVIGNQSLNFSIRSKQLFVYPNPVESEQFEIIIPPDSKDTYSLKISGLNGQTVFQSTHKKAQEKLVINTSNKLPAGAYVLEIQGFEPFKLIVK